MSKIFICSKSCKSFLTPTCNSYVNHNIFQMCLFVKVNIGYLWLTAESLSVVGFRYKLCQSIDRSTNGRLGIFYHPQKLVHVISAKRWTSRVVILMKNVGLILLRFWVRAKMCACFISNLDLEKEKYLNRYAPLTVYLSY